MALILEADYQLAFGYDGAGSTTAGRMPLFEEGQKVYRLSDFPASGSGDQPNITTTEYTILDIGTKTGLDVTVMKFLDQTLNATTSAINDESATRMVTGWDHGTTPAATTTSDTRSVPWFYLLQKTSDGTIVREVHQSQITNVTSAETFVAAEAAGWMS